MSIFTDRKTKRLFVQFDLYGHTYKKRLPEGTTREEAEKVEIKWKHDLFFEDQLPQPERVVTFKTFAENVYLPHVEANQTPLSLETAIDILKDAATIMGNLPLNKIKPATVERFKALRISTLTKHGRPRKPATIVREMSILSKLFKLAVRNDLCEYNPCSRIDLPSVSNIQDRILQLCNEAKFLNAFRNKLQHDISLTVLYTGLRQKDVLGLSVDQVDLENEEIRLVQGKTKRLVVIPILPKLLSMLAERCEKYDGLLFPSYRTGHQLTSIKNGIRFACTRAKIDRVTIRDLRRTFGTRLHENGFDDKTVADLLGHADLRSVHRYKRGTEIKKRAILSLENLVHPTKIPTSPETTQSSNALEPPNLLVGTSRVELLTPTVSRYRTTGIIH